MIAVAENLTVTVPRIRQALASRDSQPLLDVIRDARAAGARHLDLNLGPAGKGSAAALEFALEVLRGAWEHTLWIDTPDARLMERAVELWDGPLVLNGYAGGGGREGVLELAARHGLDLVVFLMEGGRVPVTADERLALAAQLVGECREAGLGPERLLVDPVLTPLGWMDGQARNAALLDVLRGLPELFGPEIRSVIGLSNLVTSSTGQARVAWLEGVFLAAAWGAGLTHAMLDVRSPHLLSTLKSLEVFADRRPFAPSEFA